MGYYCCVRECIILGYVRRDSVMAVARADTITQQTTNTLPPLYRQINREDRLVVREGVCVLGRKGRRRLSYLHTHLPP